MKLVKRHWVVYDYHPTHGQFVVLKAVTNMKEHMPPAFDTKQEANRIAHQLNLALDHAISCATVEARKELQAELRWLLGIKEKAEE